MSNTLNFNGFEVWLQLASDESVFPLADSNVIGNTISVIVPLKICRKPFEVAYRRDPKLAPVSAWFNITATSARTEKRAYGYTIKEDPKSQEGIGIPYIVGETFNLPRWSKSHGNRPEILAEVKVEVFRAKEAVTADNLRDRNNVQEYLLDKFEDGPYAVYEFSFKDGREPSQIASPISGHTTAPTSDTVSKRLRPPNSANGGHLPSPEPRGDGAVALPTPSTSADSISSPGISRLPPPPPPVPRLRDHLHVSSNSPPLVASLASTTNNGSLSYTNHLKPLIEKFGPTSKNLNPSLFQSFKLKRKASFSSDGEDVDHLDPDSPIRKKHKDQYDDHDEIDERVWEFGGPEDDHAMADGEDGDDDDTERDIAKNPHMRSDPIERLVAELDRAKSERKELEAQLKAQIAEERARIARLKAALSAAG
ncbi:hypothetical protein NLI96_g387 [Meripilus lineatus]|uniref:Uncharacterized protein n=1 Tax=Meripilus lineatus TaxID=2056292 RepID=A0AAD5VEI3_9APHY|nr:hypothetical protein NLI96_g387 [Physisporinus lineatus]